jgi:hypothetical protein
MNSESDSNRNPSGQKPGAVSPHSPGTVYLYKDSGIQENPGTIPLWLMGVVVALIIWGIYYLVAFWSPPPS